MARPKQALFTDSSDLSQLQPGDSSSSRTVRRISSYCRPLPVPSGVATGATSSSRETTFVHPPSVPQGPRARTSTLSLRSSASCTTLTTTKASVTRVRRQPSSGLSLSLSIPPTTPARPTSSIVTTTSSSSSTTAIPATNTLGYGRQPTSPVSPTSPPISPTLLSSSHTKRRKPRSTKIPCGIDESSSSSDEEGGRERYGTVLPGSRLMTGFGAFSSRGGVPVRRAAGGSGVEVVTGGDEAESAGGGGRVLGGGSSSLASTSASRSAITVPGEFKRSIITGVRRLPPSSVHH
ncbi:hypothetical protein NP233_g4148 [Leucocoprinus birnbaumii]|uniref:Uncharacterized protein n=1 Tax=Leucocoprinus birnbaumii TaxID=56174 RepID=A0AAD5VVX4_9AGAR|nr:hypothetical protein NP233_g4148 [Leucocoprinus birnbaumii]